MTGFDILKNIAADPEAHNLDGTPLRKLTELFFRDLDSLSEFHKLLALISEQMDTDAALGENARDEDPCDIDMIHGDAIRLLLAHLEGPERPYIPQCIGQDGDGPQPWDPSI